MISREIEINLIALIHLTLYLRFRDHPKNFWLKHFTIDTKQSKTFGFWNSNA